MPAKRRVKTIIDMAMTVLLPVQMAYSLIGEASHEWTGVAMCSLFIGHNLLNYRWYKALFKGRYSPLRILQTTVNLSLFLVMLGLMLSGIMMSHHVFTFLPIETGMTFARLLHMLAAYWGLVLMSLHVGLHGSMILGGIRKARGAKAASSHRTLVLRAIAVLISCYGIYAFVHRGIGPYMFLVNQFAFFDFSEPLIFFFIDYLAIMALFAIIGYYLSVFLISGQRNKNHNRQR